MAQLTDDGTTWPEDKPPPSSSYPNVAPAQPGLWQRMTTPAPGQTWSPLSVPGILSGLWSAAKNAAAIPQDVASGRMDLNDPSQGVANAGRMFDAAGTMSGLGGLFGPTGEAVLTAGARRSTAAPAIVAASKPTADQIGQIQSRAADLRRGAWPQTDTSAMFKPEDAARTTEIVPQSSIRDVIPSPNADYPLTSQRTAQISGSSGDIASAIAQRLYPWVRSGDPRLGFYNTGGIYETLARMGIDPATIMPEWAGQVAATSPRTETPSNLRNASYLLYRRGTGNPMTEAEFDATGNPAGYGMMGKQVASAERFGAGTQSADSAPKQFTFNQNIQGNLASPTIDTHNIRGSLYQFDQLNPGQLHPDWFSSPEEYAAYRANGGFTPDKVIKRSAINDSLANVTRGGVKKQIEFGPMTDPTYDAARQLGISPAQVQAGTWFNYGGVTGLRSPVRSLNQLLGDQVYDTARTLGISPERVLEWWSKKLIPLTQNTQELPSQSQIG